MRTAIALLAALVALPLAAQSPANPRVDSIFAQWDRPDSPGCALGVVQNGRFVYQRGYGMANLDYDIPNGPDMVYYVGSDSKQFTAAVVALLALDGRLSLDDDVRKWFPTMPAYAAPVTVRHLIHHTSGIRDIYALMDLRGDRMEDVFPDSLALALILRQRSTAFPPGSQYSYSNSGYFLLAQIVKRVTGQSLRVVADSLIFRPLGMTRTHFHDDPGHVMKRRAMSYERDAGGSYRISYLQNFDKIGAGGLYTTIGDLQKWDENYYTHRVGGDALQRLIHTRGILTNGDTLPYAFGNNVGTYRGLRTTEHGGSLMGYKADVLRFPDQHFSVLATCNLGAIDPGPLAQAVATIYLGDRMSPARVAAAPSTPRPTGAVTSPTSGAAAPDPATLAGSYYSEDLDVTYRVVRDGAALTLVRPTTRPLALTPAGADAFRYGTIPVRFERGSDGAVTAMVLRVSRLGEMRFARRP